MAALSADKSRVVRNPRGVVVNEYPVAASTTIYNGALVCLDASGDAVPAADTAGLRFVGVARCAVDNSAGGAGDLDVSVEYGQVEEFVAAGSISAADLGDEVFASDDQTVADAAAMTNDIKVGRLVAFSGTTATIDIGPGA